MNSDTRAGAVAHSRDPNVATSYALFTPVDHVREIYLRYRGGDWSGVLALLAPDVVLTQSGDLPWSGRYEGHAGARRYHRLLVRHVEAVVADAGFVVGGNEIAMMGKFRGRVRASGRAFDLDLVQVWTVSRGRVTRCASFTETPALRRLLGSG